MKRLLFLHGLHLLEGTIRLRYNAFQFKFFMSDFFIFINILTGDLFIGKTSPPMSERDEKVGKALKNNPTLDFSRQDPKKLALSHVLWEHKEGCASPYYQKLRLGGKGKMQGLNLTGSSFSTKFYQPFKTQIS